MRKLPAGVKSMMERKLIYNNISDSSTALPRIALFSTRLIAVGEELFW
jgi:hypothetical protein